MVSEGVDDDRPGSGPGRYFERLAGAGEGPDAVPAATVILLRDSPGRPAEVLMLRRNTALAFAGGMWVFPGGRVDPGDFADGDHDLAAAERRAAIREALEETGLRPAAESLVRFSHWTPPPQSNKRFSTAFFVAPAPVGAVTIDDGEIHDHRWATARDVLDAHRRGELQLAPPTFITLSDLAGRAAGDVIGAAAQRVVEHFATRIATLDDRIVALYHGDAGYASADAAAPGPRHRLWMDPDGWRYERDDVTRPW